MSNIDPKKSQLSQADDWLNNAIDPSTETEQEQEQEDDKEEAEEAEDE